MELHLLSCLVTINYQRKEEPSCCRWKCIY
ncbi:hypothetical protein DCAR_0104605 [Daucus carota subsp. sativus]|uniref:Uncharacterized protein n=1 Tax=Daucus carota subsp. sativus TaxID=79200 RepID=A0AAF0W8S3_DAUCS|nr:hypothetical protein DCAR_0104605 [Daucus carota subsp. sativus]